MFSGSFGAPRCFMVVGGLVAALLGAKEGWADPSSTSIEQGYDLGEIYTPRSLGMAGAVNAIGVGSTSLFNNPANMPFARVYHLEALGAFIPEARRQTYGGAIVDSILNRSRLSGGIGGTYSMLDPDGIHRSWVDLRAALAYPLGDRFSLGVTGRYLRAEQSVASGPLGRSLASDGRPGEAVVNEFTFDAGAAVKIGSSVHIGAVGHNLTAAGSGFLPLTAGGGIAFAAGDIALEGDVLFDFTTWNEPRGRYMLGGEIFLANHFPIRAGYRYDDGLRTHAVSLGLGYLDQRWGFELSGRRDVVADHPSTVINLSLRYFYDPTGGASDY